MTKTTKCIISSLKPRYDGYVIVHQRKLNKKYDYAHRIAYMKAHGEIPNSMTVDHLCRNRACINPEHMEIVTREENSHRITNARRNIGNHAHTIYQRCAECSRLYNYRYKVERKSA